MIVFTDMNECFQGTHSCSVNAVCRNTKGSYDCRCKTGYTGDGQNCTWLGKNPVIASRVGPRSYINEIDDDITSYCESKYEDADSDCNGVYSKGMKAITKSDRNDFDNDDSRTTTLMIVIVMAISWVMWK